MTISYLITGKKGMLKSVWAKFKKAPFMASINQSHRDMGEWEVAILQVEATNGIDGHAIVKNTIGKIIIAKYEIETQ